MEITTPTDRAGTAMMARACRNGRDKPAAVVGPTHASAARGGSYSLAQCGCQINQTGFVFYFLALTKSRELRVEFDRITNCL